MRFMVIRRADSGSETPGFPPAQLAEAAPAGRWLRPSASGTRLRCSGGQWSIHEGPFPADETVAGFAIVDVPSKEAALGWARGWPGADGEGNVELEVRETGCSGGCHSIDTGEAPRLTPYMVLLRSDATTEADLIPPPEVIERMNRRNTEGVRAGTVLAGAGLQPTSKGARVRLRAGRASVIDGPFTEIKELIAGFWLIQAATRQEAYDWVMSYPFPMLPDVIVELREVALPARA
jgi:hypothetical protein